MSNPVEDIRDQVGRLEDLIRLYIDQEKEQEKRFTDFSLDKLSVIKRIEQQTFGGFAVVIAILLGLTQLPILKNNDLASNLIIYYLVSAMIGLLIIAGVLFFVFTIWHRNTAWTFR